MKLELTRCADCPFLFSAFRHECIIGGGDKPPIVNINSIPEWCEIRKGPVEIKIKNETH